MDKIYNQSKIWTYIILFITGIIAFVMIWNDLSFLLTLIVAVVYSLSSIMLMLYIVIVKENSKVYINSDVKRKVLEVRKNNKIHDKYVLVNVLDMLAPNAVDTNVVKIILSFNEKGKERSRETYYINQSDDNINMMVKEICEYGKAKLYSINEFEDLFKNSTSGYQIVFFNTSMLANLINVSNNYNTYSNCIDLYDYVSKDVKYKQYLNYFGSIYQNNGLVNDKTSIMLECCDNIISGNDIQVKDLLNLEVK